jgi:hypothetical protein
MGLKNPIAPRSATWDKNPTSDFPQSWDYNPTLQHTSHAQFLSQKKKFGVVSETGFLDFESSVSVEDGEIFAATRRLELGEAFPEEQESALDLILHVGRIFRTRQGH